MALKKKQSVVVKDNQIQATDIVTKQSWDIPERLFNKLIEAEKSLELAKRQYEQTISNLVEGFIADKNVDENAKLTFDYANKKLIEVEK